jgi:hypothetical protein
MLDSATTSSPSVLGTLIPFLTGVFGYGAALLTEYLRDRRTTAREREGRQAARRVQISEHRREFQREAILALQEAVQALTRSAGKIHHHDEMQYRQSGEWGRNLLGSDINQEAHDNSVRVLLLMARVRDEGIYELTKTFRSYANRAGICRTQISVSARCCAS